MSLSDTQKYADGGWPAVRLLQHRPSYRPDIEGLRAIAVLMVVAFHARVPGFEGGFVGVDVFFVLSGYLITWLLVDEAERTGGVDLLRFYARRARRLLPALAVLLAVCMGLAALLYAPYEQRMLARSWAATALYVSNIDFAYRSLDYHGARAETNPLLHTWSLSVEEQFYLVWPWMVLAALGLLMRQRGKRPFHVRSPLPLIGFLTAASFALSLWLTESRGVWAFYLPLTRGWEFGVGALALLVPNFRFPWGAAVPVRSRLTAIVVGSLALFGLLLSGYVYDVQTPFPGMAAVLPVIATAVLLRLGSAMHPDRGSAINRLLAVGPLQTLGKLSYSWYLWHWPVLVFASTLFDPFPLTGRLAAAAFSLVLAYLSFRWVEDPLRHSRALSIPQSRSFAMALAMSLGVVALTSGWWNASTAWGSSGIQAQISHVVSERPGIYADGCDRFGSAEMVECVYGDPGAERTVVLVGDSHAGQYFPAVQAAVDQAGWRLVVLTLSACPFLDVPALHNRTLGRAYVECPEWRRSALEALERLSPDLVIVATASGYEVDTATWEEGTRRMLPEITRHANRVVLVLDPPYLDVDMPACLARSAWRWDPLDPDCTPEGVPLAAGLVEAQRRGASGVPGVEVLDIWEAVCGDGGCTEGPGGMILYRDGSHLSTQFVRTFTGTFLQLLGRGRSIPSAEPRSTAGRDATGPGRSPAGHPDFSLAHD